MSAISLTEYDISCKIQKKACQEIKLYRVLGANYKPNIVTFLSLHKKFDLAVECSALFHMGVIPGQRGGQPPLFEVNYLKGERPQARAPETSKALIFLLRSPSYDKSAPLLQFIQPQLIPPATTSAFDLLPRTATSTEEKTTEVQQYLQHCGSGLNDVAQRSTYPFTSNVLQYSVQSQTLGLVCF